MTPSIKILFIGDIVGVDAHAMVTRMLKSLIAKYEIDFCIVNGENIADGKSLTKKQAQELFASGAQIITTGNHVWDRWDVRALLSEERRILRPANYPRENAGSGLAIGQTEAGIKVGVINLQGRTYMQTIDCPFRVSNWALDKIAAETNIIIVDMHAEATAEKQAMARYLDGKVSAVLGTHTHVPTADEQILPNGTAYISDVGMTGPYEGVIGMRTDVAIRRQLYQTPHKYEMATKDVRICGVVIEVSTVDGSALGIERIVFPDFNRRREATHGVPQETANQGIEEKPQVIEETTEE